MIYTLMNKNNPVIDFETQMGTILRITDTWNEEYLPIGTRTKTGIDVMDDLYRQAAQESKKHLRIWELIHQKNFWRKAMDYH